MSERAPLAVAGSMNIDMVVKTPFIPSPGENICGVGFTMVPGGKGANQAVAAARLGMEPHLLTCVGNDYFGDFLIENLEKAGVDTSLVQRSSEVHTGVALIVVEEGTGMNTIVVDPGANLALRKEHLDKWREVLDHASHALFQLEIPLEVVAEGARMAREAGVRTVLDAGPPREGAEEVISLFDVVSPNEKELSALTGVEIKDLDDAVRAARELANSEAGTVVAKLGEWGAVVVESDEGDAWHLPAFKVKCVDATAAGDAFTAGLVLALHEGKELLEAVNFANAAGGLAVTVLGAQPSIPSREEVERLVESHRDDPQIAPVKL